MRQPIRRTGTHPSHDHRRARGHVGYGARFGLGVVVLLVIMAIGAVSASAGARASTATQATAKVEWSGSHEIPLGGGPARRDTERSQGLPPVVPEVSASGDTIFYDGFEGGVGSWTSEGGTVPTWAFFTYRPYSGSWSAYCAGDTGSGFNYPPGPYFNNMNAWLEAGPFNLSGATAATLSFKLWLNSEISHDAIFSMVSIDGQHFYGPLGDSGNTQGWVSRSIDLTNVPTLGNVCGRSQVWIAFIFQSDSSITGEGAYVDDVSIVASSGGGASRMDLDASPLVVPYRGSVDMSVDLVDVGTGYLVPGRDVQWLYCQNDLLPRVWTAGETESSSTGHYDFTLRNLVRRTYFIMYFPGDSQYTESWSNYVKVMSRAKVTPPNVPWRVRAGARITCWGTIAPQHTAAQNRASHTKVAIQRYTAGRWHTLYSLFAQKYRNSGSVTRYSITLLFAPGRWRVNATHSDIDHAKSVSSWRTFTVY